MQASDVGQCACPFRGLHVLSCIRAVLLGVKVHLAHSPALLEAVQLPSFWGGSEKRVSMAQTAFLAP